MADVFPLLLDWQCFFFVFLVHARCLRTVDLGGGQSRKAGFRGLMGRACANTILQEDCGNTKPPFFLPLHAISLLMLSIVIILPYSQHLTQDETHKHPAKGPSQNATITIISNHATPRTPTPINPESPPLPKPTTQTNHPPLDGPQNAANPPHTRPSAPGTNPSPARPSSSPPPTSPTYSPSHS
jgi:hypothetical protein